MFVIGSAVPAFVVCVFMHFTYTASVFPTSNLLLNIVNYCFVVYNAVRVYKRVMTLTKKPKNPSEVLEREIQIFIDGLSVANLTKLKKICESIILIEHKRINEPPIALTLATEVFREFSRRYKRKQFFENMQ